MRLKNKLQTPAPAGKKPKARFSPAKAAYYVFLSFMMFLMATQPVYASDVCGNEVVLPDNEDEFTIDVLYNLLCRNESAANPLPVRAKEVVAQYLANGREPDSRTD